jgi:hypothetical protein
MINETWYYIGFSRADYGVNLPAVDSRHEFGAIRRRRDAVPVAIAVPRCPCRAAIRRGVNSSFCVGNAAAKIILVAGHFASVHSGLIFCQI